MFVKNLMKKDIGVFTHEGFEFIIPPGVSAIWDSAGEALLKIYKVEAVSPGEGGIPPLIQAKEKDWDGTNFTTVTRFKISAKQLPSKNDLVRLAEKRGLDRDALQDIRYKDIPNEDIIQMINSLPIPDEIRTPHRKEFRYIDEKIPA